MPFFRRYFNINIIRLSLFFIFVIFLSIFCTNCYLDTESLEKAFLNYNDIGNNESSSNISNGGAGGFNPSNFSWDNVRFLNGGVIVSRDISEWPETSHIESFSMSSNGICVDHTMKNTWTTIIHPGYSNEPLEIQGSPWIFIPMDDGNIYAAIYEHLRSANDPVMGGNGGQVCKLGVNENTLAGVISNLVDHAKAIHLGGQAQRNAIAPIQDWYPQPGDILGFAVSTYGRNPRDYRSGSLNERSDIVWIRVPDYNTVNSGGEIVGRSSGSSTTTTPTSTNNNGGVCSSNQREPHYKEVNGQCLPSCGHANNLYCQRESASGRQCGAIARGNNCSDTNNFDIHILETYEEATCCNRKPKSGGQSSSVCHPNQNSPHYKVVGQQCLPSCGAAASMAGYGGYGPDNQNRTSDDPHVYGSNVNSCANLERFGHSDWKNFSWTDRHTSKTMNNSQIYEVVKNGGVCCVRGNPTRRTPRRRTPTTSTSTTTTQNNNGSNPQQMPNLHNVVRRLAQQHPEALRNLGGNPFSWGDYVHNQQGNVQSMEFLDRVIQKLHSIDPRFGYIRKKSGRSGEFFGPDDIAYYEGVGNPQGKNMNEGTVFVDHITVGGNPNTIHGWIKVTDYPENFRSLAQWIYPRPGAPNYGYDPNHPGTVVR